MTTILLVGIIAAVLSGVGLFVAGLVKAMQKASHDAGVSEERNAETQRQAAAKKRADEVLAESRDPDDAIERLRRGDF